MSEIKAQDSKTLFGEAELKTKECYEQITKYKEVGYNPHKIDFTAEAILFSTICENITRLKVQNRNDENKMQKLALALSDYIGALETIMDARIYLSVDMKDDAWDTMGKKIYQPRITIQEITRLVKEMLGDDYKDPGTLIPEEQRTISCVSLYSLDEKNKS